MVRRARFWVPLIGLHSGLRLNEICSLGVDDVAPRDGVDCLIVRPDAESGKLLKTRAAARVVPVHPELRRCGLLGLRYQTSVGDLKGTPSAHDGMAWTNTVQGVNFGRRLPLEGGQHCTPFHTQSTITARSSNAQAHRNCPACP